MKRNIMAIAMVMALFGCSNNQKSANQDIQEENATMAQLDSAIGPKIVKTADLRFRVKDARNTKTIISNQIKKYGGTLAEANLQTSIIKRDRIKLSTDSIMELTAYSTEALIIARIPSEQLDNFTDDVVRQADFLDQQSLKFDDQRISYMSNILKSYNRQEAVKSLETAKNTSSKTSAEKNKVDRSLAFKDQSVDMDAQNMNMDDKVKFSTITLNFYQDNTVKKLMVVNDNLSDYQPGFANRMGLSLLNGWNVFKDIIVVLANLWTVVLLGGGIYFIYLAYRAKSKASKTA